MYPDVVERGAHGEDRRHACHGEPTGVGAGILSDAVCHVPPEPLAHGVAVGVDAEHAEGACADGVDDAALGDAQILEVHERADGGRHSQQLVGVGNQPIGGQGYWQQLMEPYHAYTAQHRQHYARQCEPSPMVVAQPREETVETDVGRDEIQDTEPRHIVEGDVELGHRAQQCIDREQKQHEPAVHPPVHSLHEHIEEGNEQIEHQEAGGEPRGDAPDGHEHLHQRLRRERLVARNQEGGAYHDVVEFHLQQQLEKLPQRDLLPAHEVARDEHEAVDARLAPHAEQVEVNGLGSRRLLLHHRLHAAIHHIVVGHNEQHHYDAVQLKIGETVLPPPVLNYLS